MRLVYNGIVTDDFSYALYKVNRASAPRMRSEAAFYTLLANIRSTRATLGNARAPGWP